MVRLTVISSVLLLLTTRFSSRLLEMSVHDEYERPPAPFVPLVHVHGENFRNTGGV